MLIYSKLKSIRKVLSLSQSDIEIETGLSQRDISQLENGKKKFIPTAYIQFLNKKNIPLNLLFDDSFSLSDFENIIAVLASNNCKENCKDDCKVTPENTLESGKTKGTENSESNGYPNGYFDGYPSPIFLPESGKTKGANIIELPIIKSDNPEMVSVPVVDISVAAGHGFDNPDYMEEVDAIYFPKSMIHSGQTYLCVRIKGESMTPTLQDGGYLVIRLLDRSEWQSIREGYVYVVSDIEGRSYVKRLKNRLSKHGFIVCTSDNPDVTRYRNFNLFEHEINTVWYAEWYISAKMPNIHTSYYNKVNELEDKYDDIITQMQQMQKEIRALSQHN